MPRDYYEVLGVERDVSDRDIKKAFRKLARELHPDVNAHDPDAEERFKEAAEAYEVLSDAERRQTYDRFGHEGLRSGGWSPHAPDLGNLGEIFEAIFGGRDPFAGGDIFGFGRGPAAGADIATAIEISLDEVASGTTRELELEAISVCERCKGNGAEPGTPISTCERCGGSGQLREVSRSFLGQVIRTTICDACGGDGRVPEQPCEECDGAGRVAGERTWEVDVPAGIEDGQRIRIAGAGHAGEPGGRDGDLYVEVRVAQDPRFRRQGSELITPLEVAATTAMIGGTATVETLDGDREVEIPAGAQHGDVIALEGLGLPPLGGGRRGDQHVVVSIVIPRELGDSERELARRLDESVARRGSRV